MNKKNVITAGLAMLLAFQCAAPAFAQEPIVSSNQVVSSTAVKGSPFRDVSPSHIWYDGIMTGVERGIVKGCTNGDFNPDRPVTVTELAIMFCRAFAKEIPEGMDPVTYCVQKSWLTTNSLFDLQSKFESSIFYERLFSAAGIFLYPAELYANARTDIPNAVRVAMEFGIFDERTPVRSFITRGAAVSKIVEMQDNTKQQALPDIYKVLNITEETPGLYGSAMVNLYDIPKNILTRFSEMGWRIEFGTSALTAYNTVHHTTGVAMTSFDKKTIYIVDGKSVSHEFGHFLMYITPGADAAFSDIFKAEGKSGGRLLGSYAQTSKYEYFAEMFAYWLKYRDKETDMKKLIDKAPLTYAYFKNLEDVGWVSAISRAA